MSIKRWLHALWYGDDSYYEKRITYLEKRIERLTKENDIGKLRLRSAWNAEWKARRKLERVQTYNKSQRLKIEDMKAAAQVDRVTIEACKQALEAMGNNAHNNSTIDHNRADAGVDMAPSALD